MRAVNTIISGSLYDKIQEEKKRLTLIEKKRVKSRRRRITMITASNNLARKI